jgi:hypothetical protein
MILYINIEAEIEARTTYQRNSLHTRITVLLGKKATLPETIELQMLQQQCELECEEVNG